MLILKRNASSEIRRRVRNASDSPRSRGSDARSRLAARPPTANFAADRIRTVRAPRTGCGWPFPAAPGKISPAHVVVSGRHRRRPRTRNGAARTRSWTVPTGSTPTGCPSIRTALTDTFHRTDASIEGTEYARIPTT